MLCSQFEPSGDQPVAIDSLINGLKRKISHQILLGVTGSGKTFTIANVIQQTQRPTLILAPNKTLAAQLYGEMKVFFPKNAVEYFVSYYDYYQPEAYVPMSDTYIEKDASINEHIERMRLSATKSLLERSDSITVATVSAIYGLGDPDSYLSMVLTISQGNTLGRCKILRRLSELQYTRNDIDFRRATYRARGDVIDIFPADSECEGFRIELFGDEVEKINLFDPITGQKIRQVNKITIYPKTHYVTPKQRILDMVVQVNAELKTCINNFVKVGKLIEAQRIEQRTQFDIEMMIELGYCRGIENYSRYLSGRAAGEPPPTLVDYLPDNALLIVDESHVTIPQLGAMYKGDRVRKENLVNYGFRLPSALDNRPLQFKEFETIRPQTIYVSATPGHYEVEKSEQAVVEQVVRPTGLLDPEVEVRPAGSQVDDVLSEIKKRVVIRERVLITTLTKRMSENLTIYLAEQDIRIRYLHSDIDTVERMEIIRDFRLGSFDVLVGINLLREGLDIPEVSLVAILDADKEGFLRSERSIIQTIGRASRNVHGKAILYADKITPSMQKAICETERRRKIQMVYNKTYGITPHSIVKSVKDVMEITSLTVPNDVVAKNRQLNMSLYRKMTPKELVIEIQKLENSMYDSAKNLDFEQAAILRDQIKNLKDETINI